MHLKSILEYCIGLLENPAYNSLEVGFRHSPLTQKEIFQRYQETIQEVKGNLKDILDTELEK